jgi:Holliday junction resolvase RusA-like endonuclease
MKNHSQSLVKSNPFLVKTASSSLSHYQEVRKTSVSISLNLEELAQRVKNAHSQCQTSPTGGLISARNAGQWLLEAEGQLSPQQWKDWLKIMCNLSENTAKTYMQMAECWPGLQPRQEQLEPSLSPVVNFPVFEAELTPIKPLPLEKFKILPETQKVEVIDTLDEEQKLDVKIPHLKSVELIDITIASPVINQSPEEKPELEVTIPDVKSVELIDITIASPVINQSPEEKPELDVTIPDVKSVELIDITIASPVINQSPLSQEIQFWIPGNVVPKARPRVTSRGTYLPKQYRGWRNQAEVELYRQLCDLNLAIELPIPRANISLIFMGNHRKNADLDNLAGACLDALTLNGAGVILDDRVTCVPKLTVEYEPNAKKTGVLIKIEPLKSKLTP